MQQNVNDIDVHSIDFFNMNDQFYQHDAAEIVEEQQYYKRDESGFVGKTKYPWSAKLNTIEMAKVAFDVLEMKRVQREYTSEQFKKALNVIKPEDDMSEVLFKMFEQMRIMNDDLKNHEDIQESKKKAIKDFEKILMKEDDYKFFINHVHNQGKQLYDLSAKFSELTKEAKRILDTIRAKSDQRKSDHGVMEGESTPNHHRELPTDVKDKLVNTVKDVSFHLSSSFIG